MVVQPSGSSRPSTPRSLSESRAAETGSPALQVDLSALQSSTGYAGDGVSPGSRGAKAADSTQGSDMKNHMQPRRVLRSPAQGATLVGAAGQRPASPGLWPSGNGHSSPRSLQSPRSPRRVHWSDPGSSQRGEMETSEGDMVERLFGPLMSTLQCCGTVQPLESTGNDGTIYNTSKPGGGTAMASKDRDDAASQPFMLTREAFTNFRQQ